MFHSTQPELGWVIRPASNAALKLSGFNHSAFELMLEESFLGDWAIFSSTAQVFIENIGENFSEFEQAYSNRNLAETARLAHRIKGETSLFHIREVPEHFKAIDLSARSGQFLDEAEFKKSKDLLDRLIQELRASIS